MRASSLYPDASVVMGMDLTPAQDGGEPRRRPAASCSWARLGVPVEPRETIGTDELRSSASPSCGDQRIG